VSNDRISDAPSTAAIGGHPIHPMLIPFPIAFLTGPVVTDLAYWWLGDAFWARVSFWLLLAGLVTGAFAAVFGLIDFFTIRRARSLAAGWVHFLGNGIVLALALASVIFRWHEPESAVMPWGLVLSVVIALLLVLTGWLGGELSYRYKIGVASLSQTEVTPSQADTSRQVV